MTDDLVPEGSEGLIAQWLAHWFGGMGGYLPGRAVSKAVGHLIIGAAGVPTAGLNWLSSRIQDSDKSRSDLSKLVTATAKKAAQSDPGFGDRALVHLAGKLAKAQENRESIAIRVMQDLQSDPPIREQVEEPSEDFMNLFGDCAERASSAEMQDMFARILAGELRKPKTFSLRLIQCVSVLDQELANAVKMVRAWVSRGRIIRVASTNRGEPLHAIGLLEDMSLVRTGLTLPHKFPVEGGVVAVYGDKAVVVYGSSNQTETQIQIALLTPTGKQLMDLLPAELDLDYVSEVAKCFAEHGNMFGVHPPRVARVEILTGYQNLGQGKASFEGRLIAWPEQTDGLSYTPKP